jgi:DNA invertase Pin-like site-specific DNA recombinase
VLTVVTELRERGVRVKSLTENFDLDTKEGRLVSCSRSWPRPAEYELELRAERQADGIAAARRRQEQGQMLPGKKHIGRPRAIGPAELATLRRLVDESVSVTEAARTLKIGRSTAYDALSWIFFGADVKTDTVVTTLLWGAPIRGAADGKESTWERWRRRRHW